MVNKRKLFLNNDLVNLLKENIPAYAQKRIIQELCDRKFQWVLSQACEFLRDGDFGIRWHGLNIIRAILGDSNEYIGKVKKYTVSSRQGLLINLDTRETLSFNINNTLIRERIPKYGDIVAFKINKNNLDKKFAENIRFLG